MEGQLCIICRKIFKYGITDDISTTIVSSKILYDNCVRLFKIDEKSYNNVVYRWKWDAACLDFPRFCEGCGRDIFALSEHEENLHVIKMKIHQMISQTKTDILKSTPETKRHTHKNLCNTGISFDKLSVIEKIDSLRSAAVKDWSPVVFLSTLEDFNSDEIIVINKRDEAMTLTQSKVQINIFYRNVDGSFKCRVCKTIITKYVSNLNRHIRTAHKKIPLYQCKYCLLIFYLKSECHSHVIKTHREAKAISVLIPSINNSEPVDEIRCFICYKSVGGAQVQLSAELITTFYCSLSRKNQKQLTGKEKATSEVLKVCNPCLAQVTELQEANNDLAEYEKEFDYCLLKLKKALVLSTFNDNIGLLEYESNTGPIPLIDKYEYFRRRSIIDYSPVVRLFDIKCNYDRRSFPQQRKTANGNSIFNLVKDEEILIIDPELLDRVIPLTPDEFENYFHTTAEGKFSCKLCTSLIVTYDSAVAHCNNFHRQIKRYKCKYCEMQFYHRTQCGFHIVSVHRMEREEIAAKIYKEIKDSLDNKPLQATSDGVIELPKATKNPSLKSAIIKVNKMFKCQICGLTCKGRQNVIKHQNIVHLRNFRFKCEFCDYKTHTRYATLRHVRRIHSENMRLTDIKQNLTTGQSHLTAAEPLSTKKEIYVPRSILHGIKLLEFKSVSNIESQFTVVGPQFSCKLCGKEFLYRRGIVRHVENVHEGVRKCQCETCGLKFYCIKHCRRHVRDSHPNILEKSGGDYAFCNQDHEVNENMDVVIKQEEDVDMELQQQESNFDLELPQYGENFDPEMPQLEKIVDLELPQHEANVDPEMPKLEKCIDLKLPQYEKNFNMEFQRHGENVDSELSELHEGCIFKSTIDIGEPFLCKTENNTEGSSGDDETLAEIQNTNEKFEEVVLKRSNRIKRKSKSSKCLILKFIKPGEIIEMPKSPNYEKVMKDGVKKSGNEFHCRKCGKIFKSFFAFKMHFTVHHIANGGFKCSICNKRFCDKYKCAKHFLHKHTNRRPFVCSICDRSFASNHSLGNHLKRHVLDRPFLCSSCPLKFISEAKLKEHAKKHKNILGL